MKTDAIDTTIAYYDANAQSLVEGTQAVEFEAMRRIFALLLPSGAAILDFGCGSGAMRRHFYRQVLT